MTASYLINKKDLRFIISKAKSNMTNFNLPIYVSDSELEKTEIPSLAILESTLMYLNSKSLLVSMVSLDYTDPCADHDPEPSLIEEPKK